MLYIKEELEDLIFNQKKSYKEIGRIYGVSDTYIKKICNKLGISLKIRSVFPKNYKPHNYGIKKIAHCLCCGKERNYFAAKYCSIECSGKHRSDLLYQEYLSDNTKFCSVKHNLIIFKKRFLEDQDYKCAICKISNYWNNLPLVFILDHIDGDAANNLRENLRLVCPNCDSQLDTYKSKNKNSARKERYLKSKNKEEYKNFNNE